MELAKELEATLREFAAAEPVEVRENGGRVAPLAGLSWEVRGAAEKPLLHLWSAEYNLTRRVLAITDHSEQRLILAVERFGRSKPDRLEFVRMSFDRSAREITRHAFCEQLRRILAEQFPDEVVESLMISPDLEHSLSGNYVRGILRLRSAEWAVLGVADSESADTVENSLTLHCCGWSAPANQAGAEPTQAFDSFCRKAVLASWRNASEHCIRDWLWNFTSAILCAKCWRD
jgi:hypothetical protein